MQIRAALLRNRLRLHTPVLVAIALFSHSVVATHARGDEAADAVCSRLLPPASLAELGPGFKPASFSDADAGVWTCTWETEAQPPRRVTVRYSPVTGVRAQAMFEEYLARLKGTGQTIEPLTGVGRNAAISTIGGAFLIALHTPEAYVSLAAMNGITRDQAVAVARQFASVAPRTIDEARTALAAVRARPSAAPAELADVEVRRDGPPLPCEQLLPASEVVAVLGERYTLINVNGPRPGFSICEWKRATDAYPMSLRVHSEPEFKNANMSGPAAFAEFEVSVSACAGRPPELLPNIGEQARICSTDARDHTVIIRRAKDVIVLNCPGCTRDEAITLARSAAK